MKIWLIFLLALVGPDLISGQPASFCKPAVFMHVPEHKIFMRGWMIGLSNSYEILELPNRKIER